LRLEVARPATIFQEVRAPAPVSLLFFGPIVAAVLVLLLLPIALIFAESLTKYVPGHIGASGAFEPTLENYYDFFSPVYAVLFAKTYWLAFLGATLSVLISFPIAYHLARTRNRALRDAVLGLLIMMMFLSALVRVYSLELTFGSVGLVGPFLATFGVATNGRVYLETLVVLGLAHLSIPVAVLILIGTIQNVNPRLAEAAQSLGASRLAAHLSVTVPLSIQGILSAFLISFTLGVTAFVIPWILGKGRVNFISNLIYSRFSEMANYPSGAALSVAMLVLSLAIIYLISFAAKRVSTRG
jgi:ABC-type spermidine/putrescine transport system permease subunit I